MSTEVSIIFPNQLYKQHPAIHSNRPVYLIEEWHFFNQYQGLQVQYIESIKAQNKIELLLEKLHSKKIKKVHIVDPVDSWLNQIQ